ncbi:MAG: hypothetical protein F4X14_20155 [Caldilineaceae bacterium SB0661_bin_32]|uniref:Uncharacterized protein n=1 Tax=Caldilineaceae bacterium SB0661_bin_32 TaxID=2605255 RepID=A0A6B1DCC5_9CHLR|nr:hypothetical protein [Caldilineaceae bacterium SB0661_bin_32]
MRIEIPQPEIDLAAVLEAGKARILPGAAGKPSVNYLRPPNGPDELPALWYACPQPGIRWLNLFDGRVAGMSEAEYMVGLWTDRRQQLLEGHRDLMLWLTGWNPYDLLAEFEAELRTDPAGAANARVGALAAAVGTARKALAGAAGLQAQLTAVTPLHAFEAGSLAPGLGQDAGGALDAVAALRAELPRVRFTITPLRSYDQLLSGWTDEGVYGRVTVVRYDQSSATGAS